MGRGKGGRGEGKGKNVEKHNKYIRVAKKYRSIFSFLVTWPNSDTLKNIMSNIKSRV